MVALSDEQLGAVGIDPQSAHDYANARGAVVLAESLGETNEEALQLIKMLEEKYPELHRIYEIAVAALLSNRGNHLNSE